MKYSKFLLATAVILIIASLYGCSLTTTSTKMVTPEIRAIGLPNLSVVDSVTLKVSGPDMEPVEVSYQVVPSVINLTIPEGNDRAFELIVGLSPAFTALPTTTYTSFKGTATADINNNGAVVTLNMGIGSTKIIVPDPEWNPGASPMPRILQFDDIDDTSSETLDLISLNLQFVANSLPTLGTFNPYDIDFDNQGRIYIANNDPSTSSGIIRIDNILGTNPFFIATNYDTHGISIDRDNKIIYYFEGSSIESCDLDGNFLEVIYAGESPESFTFNDGFLYITETGDIIKHNISTGENINITIPQLINPKDILVKGNKLYIANMEGADGYQILELSTSDLSFIAGYGNYVGDINSSDLTKGNFYSPHHFAAQLNDELIILDDYNDPSWGGLNFDKIIQMDNIQGDNWKTLPATGASDQTGQDLFRFFLQNMGA